MEERPGEPEGANTQNTRNVVLVTLEGEMYDPSDLIDQTRGRIGPANDAERADW